MKIANKLIEIKAAFLALLVVDRSEEWQKKEKGICVR